MSLYAELDDAIFQAIANQKGSFTEIFEAVEVAAKRTDAASRAAGGSRSKPLSRYVDARLQALRKAGRVQYSQGHWRVRL
ncbi:hypothetical protein ARC20_03380 [Stenotrophomonas panacihumi]|uniref:Uncharacterized protein n=1 Tax=Stenotrophomonas panacihumi TaxID=676599 RepID=A0A0R0B0I5_9GAMM|nr:hypothetical protein [Stenotrophomonas panacihumi]KRG47383.1 hypothetical protein ARC20_03380 [Stenotrophomonas panacihumi]PTN55861.1 hypothetical protein C9J98_04620 [Stenotrophomonas panacihumi]